jgi:hypothetical protein
MGLWVRLDPTVPATGRSRAPAPSVGKMPGAMAYRRMPCRPHSTAGDLATASTPALDIAEGTTEGEPVQTQVTMIESTVPLRPAAIQRRPAAWGDVEGAVHDGIGHGIEAARREILGAADEVAGPRR